MPGRDPGEKLGELAESENKKMPLLTVWKLFQLTADTTNVLANDQVLGDLGRGRYAVSAIGDVADATISLFDGNSAIVSAAPISIRAAAVTYPELLKTQDFEHLVDTKTSGAALRVNVLDGSSGDLVVCVRAISGRLVPKVPRMRPLLVKQFLVSSDTTGLLASDQMFGDLGKGIYGITVIAAAAADSTYTVYDGKSNVLDAVSPAVRSAAVTYPNYRQLDDREYLIRYTGEGATLPVDLNDGSNAEIIVIMRWYGRG